MLKGRRKASLRARMVKPRRGWTFGRSISQMSRPIADHGARAGHTHAVAGAYALDALTVVVACHSQDLLRHAGARAIKALHARSCARLEPAGQRLAGAHRP